MFNERERKLFNEISKETVSFLRKRYNKITRWVIADLSRRSAYRYPNKPALIFGDKVLTYSQLDEAVSKVANGS